MPRFSVREHAGELKEEAAQARYVVDNDDAEAPVKTVRDTDTAAGRIRLALRTVALPIVKLGRKMKFNWLPRKRGQGVRDIAAKYGFDINLKKKIYDMSVSEKQTVEIIKVLYRGADILILDEPTAVLTPQETEKLFDVLRNMREDGRALSSSRTNSTRSWRSATALRCCARASSSARSTPRTPNVTELTEMMVGHKTDLNIHRANLSGARKGLSSADSLLPTTKE